MTSVPRRLSFASQSRHAALRTEGRTTRRTAGRRHLAAYAAAELVEYLTPGVHVQAWGRGVKNKAGCTVDVHDIAELVDEAVSHARR
ncbi:protein of unknown function [Paraburkholderia dioscoreae]|uniref:Uncharacterized protein n=1 Tax=Paraburkholderia dioscoreae TaxID=2604047 RepID=A0A5Q4ZVI9_9BURK|nr:protein of unknown function [Paraburkholderia dioscoreae]